MLVMTPVLTPEVLKTQHAIRLFIIDLAGDIFPRDEIATRWGFDDEPAMDAWLKTHPQVDAEIKKQQTLNKADGSVHERIEQKGAMVVDQNIHVLSEIASNPSAAPRDRTEALKLAAELSGAKAKLAAKQTAVSGTSFNLVMQFTNAPPVTIDGTIVQEVPALTTTVVEDEGIEDDV
jgi:hypothetical protein